MGLVLVLVFALLVFLRPSQVRPGKERKGQIRRARVEVRYTQASFEDSASTDSKRCWIFLFLCVYNFGNYLYGCDGTDIGCDYLLGAMLCITILYYAMLCSCMYFYLSLSKFISLYISHEYVCWWVVEWVHRTFTSMDIERRKEEEEEKNTLLALLAFLHVNLEWSVPKNSNITHNPVFLVPIQS